MANQRGADRPAAGRGEVQLTTTTTGPDEYRIITTATFERAPVEVWELLSDWERLIGVGLPGLTSDFEWLSGGPGEVPSTFRFVLAGALLEEEIYEMTVEEEATLYRLRYRALGPALGVLEYDAVFELQRIMETRTAFSATREVRLEPGTEPDMLAGMVESETRLLKEHFAGSL